MIDLGLADRLRFWGLNVVEVDGWQARGRTYATFAPRGSVNHHTAGREGSNAPSLGICINGRPDLPGPLCQAFMARDLTVHVIAAGVANHAGAGGWQGLAGNQSVHGLEIENNGIDEPATEQLMDAAARVHCAFLTAPGQSGDPGMVAQHFEWTSKKIDFHGWSGADLRARVRAHLDRPPGLIPSPNLIPGVATVAQEGSMITLFHPVNTARADDFWIGEKQDVLHRFTLDGINWSQVESLGGTVSSISASWKRDGSQLRLAVDGVASPQDRYERVHNAAGSQWGGWAPLP